MSLATLGRPPNPDDPAFRRDPLQFNRQLVEYITRAHAEIEKAVAGLARPTQQAFVITNATTTTTLDVSTATAASVANFVAALVDALNAKGITRTRS